MFFFRCYTCVPDSFEARLLGHMDVEKPCCRRKTPLVVGGTGTQVLAVSMAIHASTLNHCTTQTDAITSCCPFTHVPTTVY